MVDGMDASSSIISVDNDPKLSSIANEYFGTDHRVEIVCDDGSLWLNNRSDRLFDLIFADAWPGKYSDIELTLSLLKNGGFYVIDDMKPQPNWPEGHDEKATNLMDYLEHREDLKLVQMDWSTGVVIATRNS